jgi:polyribonucleotide nucleotidyltransferase
MKAEIKKLVGKDITAAYKLTDKSARSNALNALRDKVKAKYAEADGQTIMTAIKLTKKLEAEIVRGAILKDGKRIDGRTTTQIRPIDRWSASCPAPMVRRCSRAVKRSRSAPPRWAPRTPSR